MTVQDSVAPPSNSVPPAHFLHASHLAAPLFRLAAATTAAAAVCFGLGHWSRASWLAFLHPLGLPGLVTGSLLLSALGLVECTGISLERRRQRLRLACASIGAAALRWTAGWVPTLATLGFAGAAAVAVVIDWPPGGAADTPMPLGDFTLAAGLLVLTIPFLVMERYVATIGVEQLPEVNDLRALMFLPLFALAGTAAGQLAATAGLRMLYGIRMGLGLAVLGVCAELCLRVLALWFLPPRDPLVARAPLGSVLAGVICGRSLAPSRIGNAVRTQFGLDFSRSWALRFLRAATLPVLSLMLGFCWFLTGVTRIDLNERGSYERMGVPAAMLEPGLHLVLPWPFGIVRHAELGVVHTVSLGVGDGRDIQDAADHATVEGDPPASANRLWDSEQPSDVSYVIASGEAQRQSFQTVSASVRILYRVGATNDDARAALYHVADAGALVQVTAGRLLAQFFASRTLPSMLGENRGTIASWLRTDLQSGLDALGGGIDVVAVIIEAIHPPSGAATAYRSVQAAEIAASTEIASERGRAQTATGVAEMNARSAIDDAQGTAAETVSSAQSDLTNMASDDHPFHANSTPFLLNRYLMDLKLALNGLPLEIVDHRLNGANRATIDLRPPGAPRDDLGPGGNRP